MSQRLILVIDDEVDTVELVEAAFQRRGCEVIGAWNGSIGLQLARERRPALILIDLMLSEINSFEVCRRLRHDPALAHIPRVILSARASLTDQAAASAAGADRYLMKPVGIKVLVSVVEELLPQPC
jgi:two-component system, OmpR family, alkaline phosphatase synthesis response regulator PhoP